MSVTIWTHTALLPKAGLWVGNGWRAVEAQHKNATLSLMHGNLDDQAALENILDEVKPILPQEAEGLNWLLFTPFRYLPRKGAPAFVQKVTLVCFMGQRIVKPHVLKLAIGAGGFGWIVMDCMAIQRHFSSRYLNFMPKQNGESIYQHPPFPLIVANGCTHQIIATHKR